MSDCLHSTSEQKLLKINSTVRAVSQWDYLCQVITLKSCRNLFLVEVLASWIFFMTISPLSGLSFMWAGDHCHLLCSHQDIKAVMTSFKVKTFLICLCFDCLQVFSQISSTERQHVASFLAWLIPGFSFTFFYLFFLFYIKHRCFQGDS